MSSEITRLLNEARDGDGDAMDALLPHVYGELRRLADRVFSPYGGQTLQPTALVHEAWMKLAGHVDGMEGQRHFFSVAAKAMRQVLADHAKARKRVKRGGDRQRVTFDEGSAALTGDEVDLLALHEALEGLAAMNPRHAQVVELRVLGGMTSQEVADTLDVSRATVTSDWRMARAWLRRELATE